MFNLMVNVQLYNMNAVFVEIGGHLLFALHAIHLVALIHLKIDSGVVVYASGLM